MSDPIDRQAAIDAIDNLLEKPPYQVDCAYWGMALVNAEDAIFNLPSAQSERKKWKWKHGCCSECGYNWGKDAPIASVPNFCPNCGADMREEIEDVGKSDTDDNQ